MIHENENYYCILNTGIFKRNVSSSFCREQRGLKMWKLPLPSKTTYFSSKNYSGLEMYRDMLIKLNCAAKFIGCDVFSLNHTLYSPQMIFVLNLILFTTIENFVFIYENRNDHVQCIFGLIVTPAITQTFFRLYSFIVKKEKLIDVFYRMDKFYQSYSENWSKEIIEKNVLNSCHVGLFLTLLLLAGCIFVIIYPALIYLIFDQVTLHFGFRLLFIDWTTPLGYSVNFLNNVVCTVLFCIGTMLVCMDITMCVLCAYSQYDVLKEYLKKLNALIIGNRNKMNDDKIRKKIALIVDLHNHVIE